MTTHKTKKLLGILVAGFLLCYPASYATANDDHSGEPPVVQQVEKTVTGTVVDVQGEPLIGVSISIQGTNKGVVTNADGFYSIQVAGNSQTLQFSYIGYKPVTVKTDKARINVTMEEDAKALSEVVITGEFGLKRVANSVGSSVQELKGSDI